MIDVFADKLVVRLGEAGNINDQNLVTSKVTALQKLDVF